MGGCTFAGAPKDISGLFTCVASGPVGQPTGGYARDKDASYGDFFGGHELGDAQRRARVLKVIELIARSSESRR